MCGLSGITETHSLPVVFPPAIMKNSNRILKFEICVDTVESAVAAQNGGADRVELCDNLYEGGTTPSYGAITVARERLSIKLHIIIRPRGGDFLYTNTEFEIMRRDVETAKNLGVDGVVIGLLNADGTIDAERTRELVKLARPMSVTFHRAFDVCRDPFKALETLVEIGVDRILTSGQKATAIEGVELITDLVKQAENRIIIMACGSLDETNIASVIHKTGVREVHFTAFESLESKMQFRNDAVEMGSDEAGSEYERKFTDSKKVERIIKAAIDADTVN